MNGMGREGETGKGTKGQRDKGTRGQGDKGTRGQGDNPKSKTCAEQFDVAHCKTCRSIQNLKTIHNPNAPCPITNAQCSIPNAQSKIKKCIV